MSMWKRHSVAIVTLAATVAAVPVIAQADNAAPASPRVVAPRLGGIAHVLKPGMLAKVPESAVGSKVISVKGVDVRVSKEQLSAYQALPDDLKGKLGAPKEGAVLNPAELAKIIADKSSTVMCPW